MSIMTSYSFLVFEQKWLEENDIFEEDTPVIDSVRHIVNDILFPYVYNITI